MCGGNGSGNGNGDCGDRSSSIPVEATQWAGYNFQTGPVPDDVAGVYVYGRVTGENRVEALLVGEAVDIRAALALVDPAISGRADRVYWMSQGNPRLRAHIERILLDRYAPSGSLAAAVELPALVTDCESDDRFCATGKWPEGGVVSGQTLWGISR